MDGRRELALESAENVPELSRLKEKKLSKYLSVLSFRSDTSFGGKGEEAEAGAYHTILINGNILEISELSEEISSGISRLLAPYFERKRRILLVGLGNPKMVVDALGAETSERLNAGRRGRRSLTTLVPSVYGVTGLESATVVRGVAREISPDLVLAVDTLATRRAERLCRALQIGNVGIAPGGGVGNRREMLSAESLGVPVVSIGVPLLAYADLCASLPSGLVVTPKEIDLFVPTFAQAIANGIENALL